MWIGGKVERHYLQGPKKIGLGWKKLPTIFEWLKYVHKLASYKKVEGTWIIDESQFINFVPRMIFHLKSFLDVLVPGYLHSCWLFQAYSVRHVLYLASLGVNFLKRWKKILECVYQFQVLVAFWDTNIQAPWRQHHVD